MSETKYTYRNKQYTYEEFMAGPGGKMSTDEANAALDKASGATKTRRALQMAMSKAGNKLVSATPEGIKFSGAAGDLAFNTYGEVEKYLLDKGLIKDDKAKARAQAAAKKEKEKARKQAKKEADAKKMAEKKAAAKAKEKAKKDALKKKEAEKKAADKAKATAKKSAVKKTTAATKKSVKKAPAAKKQASVKKAGRITETAARRPKPATAKKTIKPAVKKTASSSTKKPAAVKAPAKKNRVVKTKVVSRNLKDSGFVVKIGRREYTQERLTGLALDSYKYDMGKDPRGAKVALYVKAEEKKCIFVVNGKDKGEFDL